MTSPYHRAPLTPSQRWRQLRSIGVVPLTIGGLLSVHVWLSVSSLILLTPNAADTGLFYLHPLLSPRPTPLTIGAGAVIVILCAAVLLQAKRYTWRNRQRDPERARLAALWSRAAVRTAIAGLVVCAAPVVGFVVLWVALVYWWVRMVFEVREWLNREGGYGLERRVQSTRYLKTREGLTRTAWLVFSTGWVLVNTPANVGVAAGVANNAIAQGWAAVPWELWVRLVLAVGVTGWVALGWWNFADDVAAEGSAF